MLSSCVSIVYSLSFLWETQQSLLIPSILPQSYRKGKHGRWRNQKLRLQSNFLQTVEISCSSRCSEIIRPFSLCVTVLFHSWLSPPWMRQQDEGSCLSITRLLPGGSPRSSWWTSCGFPLRCPLSACPEQISHPQPSGPKADTQQTLHVSVFKLRLFH